MQHPEPKLMMSDSIEQQVGDVQDVNLRGYYIDLVVVHDEDQNVSKIFRNHLKTLRAPTTADQALFVVVDHVDLRACLEFQSVAANLTVTSVVIGHDEEPIFKLPGPFAFVWSEIKFKDGEEELTIALVKRDVPQSRQANDNT